MNEDIRAVLADRASPLAQIVKAVSTAEAAAADLPEIVIGLSSNVVIDLLGLFLRREALLAGVRARIVPGEYDDPIGDMERFAAAGVERVVLIPFFDNILPAFEAQLGSMPPAMLDAKEAELRARYRLAFGQASGFKSVQCGLHHRFGRGAGADGADPVAAVVERFNVMLREEASAAPGVHFLDLASLVADVGRDAAYDPRFYFRSKAPYSAAFLSAFAARITASSRGFGTQFYKALALDCDNTLWGGVIGEDLVGGIKLDPFDAPGNIFWRVQHMLSGLEKAGLLLCLCTKNNPADVEEVFASHPNMVLQADQIAAKRVNWSDKVANLQSLAAELNIGLDSIIFLDDSPVEAEEARTRLPMVRMVQVPSALPDYPAAIEEISRLFLAGGAPADAASKTELYRQRAAAAETVATFETHEDYLASLDLKAELHVDSSAEAPRITELSLKSNQFNLTTRRYTEREIRGLMAAEDAEVISVTVRNKFGNAGLTGILVLRFQDDAAMIETFLMSCRVLGQGVEFALWRWVAERARARGCTRILAAFLPTAKNAQVRDFYDRLGLTLDRDEADARHYSAPLDGFAPPSSPWVKVIHD